MRGRNEQRLLTKSSPGHEPTRLGTIPPPVAPESLEQTIFNMKLPLMSLALSALVLAGVIGCSDDDAATTPSPDTTARLSGRLTLTGSSTLAPVMSEIGKRFEAAHPDVRIDVQTGGSSRGIADAAAGLADLGMSSRDLKPGEGANLSPMVVARDGVAFVVNAANPVDALTDEQLRAIFTGRITDWGDVGGKLGPITVVNRAAGRSELELVSEFWGVKPEDLTATLVGGENQQVVKTVAGDPTAISYLAVGTAEYEAEHGAALKSLPLEGVRASSETVAAGTYPLVRPLLLLYRDEPSPLVRAFVEYAQSPAVHEVIREQGFVPAEESRDQGWRR